MPTRTPPRPRRRTPGEDIQVIAHRGAVGYAPENTLPAFQLGAALGGDWIETDVHRTADDAYALMHDLTVDRTTNGAGRLADLPLAAIRGLDAGAWFDARYAGTPVPTLDEFLAWAAARPVGICLDLGRDLGLDDIEAIAARVGAIGWPEGTLAMSWNPAHLERLKQVQPAVATGLLFRDDPSGAIALAARLGVELAHPFRHIVTPELIAQIHAAGLVAGASVNSDVGWIAERYAWGLDVFNCDHPDLPRRVIAGPSPQCPDAIAPLRP